MRGEDVAALIDLTDYHNLLGHWRLLFIYNLVSQLCSDVYRAEAVVRNSLNEYSFTTSDYVGRVQLASD